MFQIVENNADSVAPPTTDDEPLLGAADYVKPVVNERLRSLDAFRG